MKRSSAEKIFAQIIIACGLIIMIFGTYANIVAMDTAKTGSHLEEKASHELLIEQSKAENQVKLPVEIPTVIKLEVEEEEVKISDDGIKKEEQEIADEKIVESKDPQAEIQEKNEEIEVLKESKNKLEKEVQEMKEVLVKQNKETQELVLQKFEEIAEKVEKIEKQSLEGPGGKDKTIDEKEKLLTGEVKAPAEVVMSEAPEKPLEVNEKPKTNRKVQEPVLPQQSLIKLEPVPINKLEIPKSSDLNMLEVEKSPEMPVPVLNATFRVLNETGQALPQKLQANESRGDPIVKLIKSQEPLSYQVGEKMMQGKSNATKPELLKPKLDSAENEIKNEMRKKRDTSVVSFNEALSSLGQTMKNFEMQSMMTRDLKAAIENEN